MSEHMSSTCFWTESASLLSAHRNIWANPISFWTCIASKPKGIWFCLHYSLFLWKVHCIYMQRSICIETWFKSSQVLPKKWFLSPTVTDSTSLQSQYDVYKKFTQSGIVSRTSTQSELWTIEPQYIRIFGLLESELQTDFPWKQKKTFKE